MGDTVTADDILESFKVNYGLAVQRPQSFAGIKIIVSDNVPDGQILTFGEDTIVSRTTYAKLKDQIAEIGSTTAEATDAMQRMGKVMSGIIEKQLYGALAGTPLDPNPEQTEMERSALWGQF